MAKYEATFEQIKRYITDGGICLQIYGVEYLIDDVLVMSSLEHLQCQVTSTDIPFTNLMTVIVVSKYNLQKLIENSSFFQGWE